MFQVERKSEMPQTQVDRDMEEILSSIRQIIAEDVEESEKSKSPKLSLATSSREEILTNEEENILELTNMLSEDVYKGPLEKATARKENSSQDQSNKEKLSYTTEEGFQLSPALKEPQGLISQEVAKAVSKSIDDLPHLLKQAQSHQDILSPTIENTVRDSLPPLLQAWLDKNLTKIVKEVVAEEIEKVLKK